MPFNGTFHTQREKLCLMWAGFGLYLFLSAFFWASGPAPLRTVYYLFLLFPFICVLPWRKFNGREYGGIYTLAALTLAGYLVLASLWGNPQDFIFYLKQWFFLAFWLCGVTWLFFHRKIQISRLRLMIIALGSFAALVTIYLFYIYDGQSISYRLMGIGMAENPTVVAQIFGVAALLAYLASLNAQRPAVSLLYFFSAAVSALPIVMSQTRGAGFSLIAVSLMALIILRPRWIIWVPQLLLAILAIAFMFAFTDFAEVLELRGLSLSLRDIIWLEVLARSWENPIVGIGLVQDARIQITDVGEFHHAHNTWLDTFYYAGLLGVLLSLWHLLLMLRCFSRDPDLLPFYLWFVFGCLCLFTNGSQLLTRPDAQWWMYWVPAGLLTATYLSRRECRKE